MSNLMPRGDLPAGRWPARRLATAVVTAIGVAVLIGVPTGLLPTPLYTRMTPPLWWNYPIWVATAVLGGLLAATYVRRPGDDRPHGGARAASGGGLLTAFAVGCPMCNKLVVAVLGMSGAVNLWAPLQPVLGVASILGLAWALRRRLTNEYACPVGARPAIAGPSDPDLVDPLDWELRGARAATHQRPPLAGLAVEPDGRDCS